MSKSIKRFLLASVLSFATLGAALAADGPGSPTDGTGRSHASAAPACGYECPVLAGDGGPANPGDNNGRSGARMATDGAPGNPGDKNGRSMASATGRSGQIPSLWRQAGGAPGNGVNWHKAPSRGNAHTKEFLVASIRAGGSDF